MKRNSQQGVALVITLILLSVITFMAVTFLVVSRREGGQVATITQQTAADLAAAEAVEQAKAQIIAQMLATGNGLNFGMLVSTNYINSNYVDTGSAAAIASLTNVSYNLPNANDLQPMLNNLLILPRAPVFVTTNRNQTGGDFRFWLDLNRNGKYDQNGLVQEFKTDGTPVLLGGNPVFLPRMGDPEWIGILNRPDYRHSSSNFFLSRFAFIALPIGNSLDMNYIHNQAKQLGATSDGYRRNQGVGSWELNLAAMLNTLDTNIWANAVPYIYSSDINSTSSGTAFVDAVTILQYRYNNSYLNLAAVPNLNSVPFAFNSSLNAFKNDIIDEFTLGTTTNISPYVSDPDNLLGANRVWSGTDNPSQYFSTQDLFTKVPYPQNDPANANSSFSNRLYQAGFSLGTDDRYTFYRLLSQMSFGSASEPSPFPSTPRVNLNYNNILLTNNLARVATTNFIPWTALQFFTNAADRMLQAEFPNPIGIITSNALSPNILITNYAQLSITNIPIYPANFYTPAVHRILQLAANIYDATTNHYFPGDTNCYPSVFRPLFGVNGTNVYIRGYMSEDLGMTDYQIQPLSLPEDLAVVNNSTVNIYDVPWIIGAKKGLPNFNKLVMQSYSQITRKVQIVKKTVADPVSAYQTNIQYVVAISNVLAVEAWNSYALANTRSVDIFGLANMSVYLTNELGILTVSNFMNPNPGLTFGANPSTSRYTIVPGQWAGYNHNSHNSAVNRGSFQLPLYTNVILISNMVYRPNLNPHFNLDPAFEPNLGYIQPQFGLNFTNRLRFAIIDTVTGRILDYVQFGGMNYNRNLTAELMGPDNGGHGGVWDTNRISYPSGMIRGVINQIEVSQGTTNINGYAPVSQADWIADQLQASSESSAQAAFFAFMTGTDTTNLSMQAPFTPTRKVSITYTWEANDPLVHYTLSDLSPQPAALNILTNYISAISNLVSFTNGVVNRRYSPWGNLGNAASSDTNNLYTIAVKDPLVSFSDAWQFPTNPFPSIGWLGNVHRGTPWQTVYMKSDLTDITNWVNWTGDTRTIVVSNADPTKIVAVYDASFSMPNNDWPLFDVFTTAPNENASHGQLSINQTNLAAWAAVLSGVTVVSNQTISGGTVLVATNFIDPTHTYLGTNVVQYLCNYINSARTNYPQNTFTSVGQLL